ncbi:MAG: hypothetical protein ACI4P4_14435 [Faecousia sp.]
MADLIDREALLWEYKTNNKYRANAASVAQCIHDAPTFDAVEVVRCEDCKHLLKVFKEEVESGGGICGKAYGTGKIEGYLCRVNAGDFCSYGERKNYA